MSTPSIIVGATLHVAPASPAEFSADGFEALGFTQVRGMRAAGSLAKQYQTVAFVPLTGEMPHNRRVARAPQSIQIDMVRLVDDGQAMLRAAIDQDVKYSYRLTLPDLGPHYFIASATSRTLGVGDASGLATTSLTLDITSEVIEPT